MHQRNYNLTWAALAVGVLAVFACAVRRCPAQESNKVNPDGSAVPSRHTKPWSEIAKRGRIGLQGKHQGSSTFFRNIRIIEGEWKGEADRGKILEGEKR